MKRGRGAKRRQGDKFLKVEEEWRKRRKANWGSNFRAKVVGDLKVEGKSAETGK